MTNKPSVNALLSSTFKNEVANRYITINVAAVLSFTGVKSQTCSQPCLSVADKIYTSIEQINMFLFLSTAYNLRKLVHL